MKRICVGDFELGKDEIDAVMQVLIAGRVSEGKNVGEFEKEWASYIGTDYSVALSSGTSALMAGWQALYYYEKMKGNKGKKVITSPITYIASSNVLVLSRFEPVYIDVDPKTFIITPECIEEHLKNSKDIDDYIAINPIHIMGNMCDMDKINAIAKKYNLVVVEDAAQAHGSIYKNKKAGSMSLFSIFSFYIAHNIQAGEMGALNTSDQEIYKLVKKLKANGRLCDCIICRRSDGKCPRFSSTGDDIDPRFTHDFIGFNFKITEFQACLAKSQIKKADDIFNKRLEHVKYLNEKLEKWSKILQLPIYDKKISYLAYPIVIKDPKYISRKKLRYELEKHGIENRPLFGCIPTQQPAYSFLKDSYKGKLPNAEYLGKNAFYIGCHQYLTQNDLDYVVSIFEKILK